MTIYVYVQDNNKQNKNTIYLSRDDEDGFFIILNNIYWLP